MKTILSFLPFICFSLVFYSCETKETVVPSEKITTQQETFTDYHSIDASNAFTVYVSFSETEEKIEIEANENVHPYIIVEKVSDKLIIKLKDNISIKGSATLHAYITTKEVIDYSASGASRFLLLDKLSGKDVGIWLSGASIFNAYLDTESVSADLSGASVVDLAGSSDLLQVSASGASTVRSYAFIVKDLTINLSGASNAYLTVNVKMDVVASGASNLYYKGTAVINSQDLSGGSNIQKMD
ncbi:hypothetical protein ES705_16541 [subsurface metagenome]